MANKVVKISTDTDLVQYFLTIREPRFEDWCATYSKHNILTKSLREKAQAAWKVALDVLEQQRQEELARRKAIAIERAKGELAAALSEVKSTLPFMVEKIKDRIERELEIASEPFTWSEIDHPLVNGEWELHYNEYECWREQVAQHYSESPDGMRSGGVDYVWRTRERGAGSYWLNSLTGSKEFFVSRAESAEEPAPEIVYPYCTIQVDQYRTSDLKEIMWYKEQALQRRRRAQEWVQEAEKALADTSSNLEWIVDMADCSLYNRIRSAVRVVEQLDSLNEIRTAVSAVFASLA